MSFAFHGKRVVVTGGSKGIGRAIALAFAGAGAAVSACARGAQALESTRADIALAGVKAHAGVCDLADGLAVTRYVAEAGAALGGIDMPVNIAYPLDEFYARSGLNLPPLDQKAMETVRDVYDRRIRTHVHGQW